jgi:hypothetical protein
MSTWFFTQASARRSARDQIVEISGSRANAST